MFVVNCWVFPLLRGINMHNDDLEYCFFFPLLMRWKNNARFKISKLRDQPITTNIPASVFESAAFNDHRAFYLFHLICASCIHEWVSERLYLFFFYERGVSGRDDFFSHKWGCARGCWLKWGCGFIFYARVSLSEKIFFFGFFF